MKTYTKADCVVSTVRAATDLEAQFANAQEFFKFHQDAFMLKYPHFEDQKNCDEMRGNIAAYLREKGFSDDEITGIRDYRVIEVIIDAASAKAVSE